MERAESYSTKQREAILEYIISLEGEAVKASQIVQHFQNTTPIVGRTTVYRQLNKLTQSGVLRRDVSDNTPNAFYRYATATADCHTHMHLKCEVCGALQHLECDILSEIEAHMLGRHAFQMNAYRTVLLGTCENCIPSSQ
ncbi:MAG: transcriptional repressor [Oscillospiraceae bacterium]|nr:transcriptional repressor [Oscillospiraceae bacterium]